MNFGELILSKIVEQNKPEILTTYKIKRHHFQTKVEREAYDFILDYVEKNHQAPDYRILVSSVKGDFTFMPNVKESFESLAESLKEYSAKVQSAKLLQEEAGKMFQDMSGPEFLKWLREQSLKIEEDTSVRKNVGSELKTLSEQFREEYMNRKSGKSKKAYKTPFPTMTEEVGGFSSTEVYGIFAESGRGKSYLSAVIIHDLLKQGANVLVKSFEIRSYQWLARLFSIMTADKGAFVHEGEKVGFKNKRLLAGHLEEEQEEYLFEMLDAIENYYPGKLYLQAKGDKDLTRTLDDLESELSQYPEIDVVFLDPFYGLLDVYSGRNANKTAGGAAEAAANRFEILCGDHDVIGFYTIQASIERSSKGETGKRELKLPNREQLKTTKRLLDIASLLIGFDSSPEGIAKLGIEKGRSGGEGFELELLALMDYGVLKEFPTAEEVIEKFGNENDIFSGGLINL